MSPADSSTRRERADRILDAAADLLLRVGYRRVTVEDVADLADVGKGTIYLHWKTREQLFLAVLQRDAIAATDDLVSALRADPTLVVLPELTRTQYLGVLRRPALFAAYNDDSDVLGKLTTALHRTQSPQHYEDFENYLELLSANGLLRTGRPVAETSFAYRAVLQGFLRAGVPHDLDARADLLAETVAHAFQPDTPATHRAAEIAPEVIAIFAATVERERAELTTAY